VSFRKNDRRKYTLPTGTVGPCTVSIVKDRHSFPDGLCRAAEGRSLRSELPAFCPVNKSSGDKGAQARWDALRRRVSPRLAMPVSAETDLRKRTMRIDPSGLALTSFLHGSLIGRFKRLPDSANPKIPAGPKRGSKSRSHDTHVHVFWKGFLATWKKYFWANRCIGKMGILDKCIEIRWLCCWAKILLLGRRERGMKII
jgi:hypothetical protein